jgi:hypothetical protein
VGLRPPRFAAGAAAPVPLLRQLLLVRLSPRQYHLFYPPVIPVSSLSDYLHACSRPETMAFDASCVCAASRPAATPHFTLFKLKLAVHRASHPPLPTSSGFMATITAPADRPLVVSTFNREQLIGRSPYIINLSACSSLPSLGHGSNPCFQPYSSTPDHCHSACRLSSVSSVLSPLFPCPSFCPVFATAHSRYAAPHALFLKPLPFSTSKPLPYPLSFQRGLDQATPLKRAPGWRPNPPNLARRNLAKLLGEPCSRSTAVVNSSRTSLSYSIVLHMPAPLPQYSSIPYKRPLPHYNKQSSNVSSYVKHFAAFAGMGLLALYSPSAQLQEDTVRVVGRATSYPAEPIHHSMHHVLRSGIQLAELYLNSLIAARHYLHVQQYGPMSFSLIRVDLHNTLLQSAIQNASSLSLISGLFPLLQVLYIMIREYLLSNTTFYTRHSRKSTRARLRKQCSSCIRLAYRTLLCISVLYPH